MSKLDAPISEIESENDLLTMLFADRTKVEPALSAVSADDFYDPVNRMIFSEIAQQCDSDWGPTSVCSQIRRQSGEDAFRQALARWRLLEGEPYHGSVTEHAGRIRAAAADRRLVSALAESLELARARLGPQARACLESIEPAASLAVEPVSMRDAMLSAYEVARAPRQSVVLTTGHHEIDDMTGGLRPGHTWVVAGATSAGKSSYAIAIVAENCAKGHRCLIVSLEDPTSLYGSRFLTRAAGVDASSLRDHRVADGDHRALLGAIEAATSEPVILAANDQPWERVLPQIDHLIRRYRIELVVLDYIQEAWGEKKYGQRQLELQAIARSFRSLVRRHGCCGIVCSQLTGSEPGKAPTKEMVRECKDISNGAEVVMLLYSTDESCKVDVDKRKDVPRVESRLVASPLTRKAHIDKCKDGRCGIVSLDWEDKSASYRRVTRLSGDSWVDERYEELQDIDNAITGAK